MKFNVEATNKKVCVFGQLNPGEVFCLSGGNGVIDPLFYVKMLDTIETKDGRVFNCTSLLRSVPGYVSEGSLVHPMESTTQISYIYQQDVREHSVQKMEEIEN